MLLLLCINMEFLTSTGLAQSLSIPVVEDCATSIGAVAEGRPAGSFGDVAAFSFYATKMLAGRRMWSGCWNQGFDRSGFRTYRTPRGADESADSLPVHSIGVIRYSGSHPIGEAGQLHSIKNVCWQTGIRHAFKDQFNCPVIPDRCIPVWHRYIVETEELQEKRSFERASAGRHSDRIWSENTNTPSA